MATTPKKILLFLSVLAAASVWADLPQPIASFQMEKIEDGVVADSSGNGRDLTVGSACTIVSGLPGGGKALHFDGTPNSWSTFACPVSQYKSLSFWIYREADDGSYYVGRSSPYPYYFQNWGRIGSNYTANNGSDAGSLIYFGTSQVNFGRSIIIPRCGWHHVVYCVSTVSGYGTSAPQAIFLSYLDGVQTSVNSSLKFTAADIDSTCCLGNSGEENDRPILGSMADVNFYDCALTPDQVQELYQRGAQNLPKYQEIGHWPMNRIDVALDGSRTTPDISDANNPMRLGASTWVTNGVHEGEKSVFIAGSQNSSAKPDPTAAWGQFTNTVTSFTSFTLAYWIRRDPEMYVPSAARILCPSFSRSFITCGYSDGDYNVRFADNATSPYYASQTSKVMLGHREWSHITITCEVTPAVASSSANYVTLAITFYMNGEYISGGNVLTGNIPYTQFLARMGAKFTFANAGIGSLRGSRASFQDVRMWAGVLSPEDIRILYRGAAKPDAGEDFTTTASETYLRGRLPENKYETGIRMGFAGTPTWSVVEAPEGVELEDVKIENPHSETTRVNLPAEGEYVFRLTNTTTMQDSDTDEVRIERLAQSTAMPPTVSDIAVESYDQEDFAVYASATATGADRVRWLGVSGPGGVWFRPGNTNSTMAVFSEPGHYRIKFVAENSAGTAETETSVDIGQGCPTDGITNGLMAYCSFNYPNKGIHLEDVNKYTVAFKGGMHLEPSIVGYGLKSVDFYNSYAALSSGFTSWEIATSPASGENITNDHYIALSAWIYHDGNDKMDVKHPDVVSALYRCGLYYNVPESNGFTIHQQGKWGSPYTERRYNGPAGKCFTNRWVHVLANICRSGKLESEVWVDGEKMSPEYGADALCAGRTNTDSWEIGGREHRNAPSQAKQNDGRYYYMDIDPMTGATNKIYSRRFPGIVDEVRFYNRKLEAREIKYLANMPNHGNWAPVTGGEQSIRGMLHSQVSLAIGAGDDGLPVGGELTFKWVVLEGDESALEFETPEEQTTIVKASRAGTWTLALRASDGERVSYGGPVVFSTFGRGMCILHR